MAEDESPGVNFAVSGEAERRQKIETLSDEDLRRLHGSLHASKLINETVWVPLIEQEMIRRGMLDRS